MQWLFWISFALVVYAYFGYAVVLSILARLRPAPVRTGAATPTVSIIIAAHNEAANLPRKFASLRAQTYPGALMQVIVVSDGSTDGTELYLQQQADWVTYGRLPLPAGKASALNHGVSLATGELLIFMDARQTVDAPAVVELVRCFADSSVGAVSGELHLLTAAGDPSPDALGLYWRIEKAIRKLESATGSTVGVTGALFAMRRELFVPLPEGTLLDDVLTPMHVARAGYRVLFQDTAVVRDRIFTEPGKEFRRKVRTLTGNYQLLQLAPWLLTPRNPLLFRFVSHKLLRLAVPLLLALMLVGSILAGGPFYQVLTILQLLVYGMALMGAVFPAIRRLRLVSVAYTFAMLNAAAAAAFYNFLRGRARWA